MKHDPLPQNSSFFFERSEKPSEDMIDRHLHNLFEMYYLEDGECNYFIDGHIYHMKPMDIILIPKGLFHKTSYLSQTRLRTVMNFSSTHIPTPILQKINSSPYQIRCTPIRNEIQFYINQIEQNYHSDQIYANEILVSSLEGLLLTLFRNIHENKQPTFQTPLCSNILQYIQEHYAERLAVCDVAQQFSISESYLGKLLKRECGLGFSEYLTSVRLQNARKKLISDSTLSVTEVAYQCGYSDSNYFSTCFKRAFGVPPNALRGKSKHSG